MATAACHPAPSQSLMHRPFAIPAGARRNPAAFAASGCRMPTGRRRPAPRLLITVSNFSTFRRRPAPNPLKRNAADLRFRIARRPSRVLECPRCPMPLVMDFTNGRRRPRPDRKRR